MVFLCFSGVKKVTYSTFNLITG